MADNDMRTRNAILIAVAAVPVVAASYASPYWTMRQLRLAADAGDADALAEYVDFPALRESMRGELMARIVQPMLDDPKMKDNPFAGFGMMMATAMVGPMVDAFVSPSGVAAMLKAQKPKVNAGTPMAIQTSNELPPDASKVVWSRGYESINKFVVGVGTAEQPKMFSMTYKRDGWFSWKLARISLPDAK